MKMTINISKFFKEELWAYKHEIKEDEFKNLVGEAVYKAASRLLPFRESNEEISIDSFISFDMVDAVVSKNNEVYCYDDPYMEPRDFGDECEAAK